MPTRWHYSKAKSKKQYRDIYNKYLRDRATKMRARLSELKKAPCMDCGNKFHPCAMDFDHVRGRKKYCIASLASSSKSWETILKEVAKCELVCANCHRIRSFNRNQYVNKKSKRK